MAYLVVRHSSNPNDDKRLATVQGTIIWVSSNNTGYTKYTARKQA